MIVNSKLTIYHKGLDTTTRLETWTRFNYDNVWWYGGKGASTNAGYDNANDVQIRIPYDSNEVDIKDIAIGDILVKGELNFDIVTQQDLLGYEQYNVTALYNNDFGSSPHIRISGR